MASKRGSLRLKREKDDLENNPIQKGNYTSDKLYVNIDIEENVINIMYIPNEEIVYEFRITVPRAFPFDVPVLHYTRIEEYDENGEQKTIKKPYQSWASISPNASVNNVVLNEIDTLIASWNANTKLRDFIPEILDIVLPLLERYQADEQAKKENAARVIQKKYINARSWIPGQKRIAASFAPPSRRNAVYRGGPAYEAIKGKYGSKLPSIQDRVITRGGRRRKRKKTKRRKQRRKKKTLRRKSKSKKH